MQIANQTTVGAREPAPPQTETRSNFGDLVDLASFLVALVAAFYAYKQKKIASDALKKAGEANDLAAEANKIASKAQSSARDLARATSIHADALAQFNAECGDKVRRVLSRLQEFPRDTRSAVEHQQFTPKKYLDDWSLIRTEIDAAKEAFSLQMREALITPHDFQACFVGGPYDDLAEAAQAVGEGGPHGLIDRVDRLRTVAESFTSVVRLLLSNGRDTIAERHFGPSSSIADGA